MREAHNSQYFKSMQISCKCIYVIINVIRIDICASCMLDSLRLCYECIYLICRLILNMKPISALVATKVGCTFNFNVRSLGGRVFEILGDHFISYYLQLLFKTYSNI